jgi:uncharacterized protein (DUF1015 family)
MLRIKPFQALRPAPQYVAEVTCVPYDVVNRAEAAVLAEGLPNSLLHVDRAEIDLPSETNPYSELVYTKAAQNFRRLQEEGVLIRDREAIYVYQQRMGGHVQTGLAAVCHIEDYERGVIKKHENTRRDKEDDRTRLIDTLSADTGPVFLTYRDHQEIDDLIAEGTKALPLYDLLAPDGVAHTVWRVAATEELVKAFSKVPLAYVADGHHRTASACRVGRERRASNPHHTGDEDYNWFLAVLFPATQLQILPYNRVVKDLNGHDTASLMHAISQVFDVRTSSSTAPQHAGTINMYLGQAWFELNWTPDEMSDPISRLDVSALQDRVLGPVLGIDDPRTSNRIDFVGGIRGTGELVERVDSGAAAVAFSMFPTTVEQLMAIADADQIMPPKSTWFEPKLRSGFFIHTF